MQALPIKECMAWFYVNLHYDYIYSWHEYMHAWFTLVHTCTHVQSSWSSVWFVSYLGDCRTHCFMDSSLRAQWSHHCVWSVYQQQWSVQPHQHISHTTHTERPPSKHCYYIQCQSIHHHRTRRVYVTGQASTESICMCFSCSRGQWPCMHGCGRCSFF